MTNVASSRESIFSTLQRAEAALGDGRLDEAELELDSLTGLVSDHPQLEAHRVMIRADLARQREDYAAAFKGYTWIRDSIQAKRKAAYCALGVPPDESVAAALKDVLGWIESDIPSVLHRYLKVLSEGFRVFVSLTEKDCTELNELTSIPISIIKKNVLDMNIFAAAKVSCCSITFASIGEMTEHSEDEVYMRIFSGLLDDRFSGIQFDTCRRVLGRKGYDDITKALPLPTTNPKERSNLLELCGNPYIPDDRNRYGIFITCHDRGMRTTTSRIGGLRFNN